MKIIIIIIKKSAINQNYFALRGNINAKMLIISNTNFLFYSKKLFFFFLEMIPKNYLIVVNMVLNEHHFDSNSGSE